MSFAAFALVVLAAFIHATWNLLSKRAANAGAAFVLAYTAIACVGYAPWVAWLLARGDLKWSAAAVTCIALSGAIHLAYSLCLQRGYQVADLSVVYPVARGTGPMLSSLGAFLLLGEMPSAQGLLGLFAVVLGIGLISTQGNLANFRRPGGQAGLRWGGATGFLIANYTVVDAYAVKTVGIQPVILDWFANLVRVVLLAPIALRNPYAAWARMRNHWPLAIGVGLLSPLSYILVLAALESGAPLSIVAPLREMSMMVGAVFGMIILHEPVGRGRLLGCLVLAVGVILLGSS